MLLRAEHLTLYRHGRTLVRSLNPSLAPHQLVAVLGPNGAGKSTLLGLLAGETPPDEGSLSWRNQPLAGFSLAELARRRAYLMQHHENAPGLSGRDVVEIGLFAHGDPRAHQVACRQAVELAQPTLLPAAYDTLSGGEQARVQFARVLAQVLAGSGERLLLLDEPTSALDPAHQNTCWPPAASFAATLPLAVVVVLHDLNLAARHADRVVLLDQAAGSRCRAGRSTGPRHESKQYSASGCMCCRTRMSRPCRFVPRYPAWTPSSPFVLYQPVWRQISLQAASRSNSRIAT